MTRLGRLAGALVLEAGGRHYLIGNLKRPCDFGAAGFATPAEGDTVVPLARHPERPLALDGVFLSLPDPADPEALAHEIARRLVIPRTGAVSDRLWRLILVDSNDPDAEPPTAGVVPAHWLCETPAHVWQIVRDAVLTCS